MVSNKSSLVISEKGRDWVQHLLHCQSRGREEEFFLVSLTHFKWLNLLQVVHCGILAPLLIFLEHVSHLVFLGNGAQLVKLLLKKSRISFVSKKASGKAEWWHWSQSQSTPRFLEFRYSAVLILAHLTWKPFLQWWQRIWVRLAEMGLGQRPQRLSDIHRGQGKHQIGGGLKRDM